MTAIEKIGETVYHLPEVHGGPTILLGDDVVLVDTGVPGSETAILAAVEELGRTAGDVTDIVITHADGDHVGGLAALVEATGATVWASAQEADVIEGRAPARSGDVQRRASVGRRFEPGETLPLHGGIETHDTHGHTVGHVSLLLPAERILIAGDALNNRAGIGRLLAGVHRRPRRRARRGGCARCAPARHDRLRSRPVDRRRRRGAARGVRRLPRQLSRPDGLDSATMLDCQRSNDCQQLRRREKTEGS